MTPIRRILPWLMVLALGAVLWAVLTDDSRERSGDQEQSEDRAAATAPRPAAASTPTPPAETRTPIESDASGVAEDTADTGFAVIVSDEQGDPIVGAAVHLCDSSWRAEKLWARPDSLRSRTDALGFAFFDESREEHDRLLVVTSGRMPLNLPRDNETQEQHVRFDQSPSLAGTIRIDGQPADPSIEFELNGFLDPSANWGSAVQYALSEDNWGWSRLRFRTRSDGNFTVFGLPAGERVTLEIPAEWRLLQGDVAPTRQIQLQTIDLNIALDLRRLPSVHGRPVWSSPQSDPPWSDDARPNSIRVRYSFIRANGEERHGSQRCQVGKPFSIPFLETDLVGVQLKFEDGWGVSGERLGEVEWHGALLQSHDFGDIVLESVSRQLRLKILSADAQPIENARALVGTRVSARSDRRGFTHLPLRAGDERVTVGAFGFELQRVELPRPLPDPLEVVMVAANRLRLIVTPAGTHEDLRGLSVALHQNGEFPEDAPERHTGFEEVHGQTADGAEWESGGSRSHYYDLAASGVFERSDLPVDTSFTIALQDAHQYTLFEQEMKIGRGELRELRWTLPRSPAEIAGRVVNEDGEGITGAMIDFGNFFAEEIVSDETGRFQVTGLFDPEPEFWISAEGYAETHVRGPRVFQESRFRMERARTVWVEVLSPGGERMSIADIRLEQADELRFSGNERGVGLYQFDRVPRRWLTARGKDPNGKVVTSSVSPDSERVRLQF